MTTVSQLPHRITVHDGAIVAFTPFVLKDACKAIPGARWSPELKAWTYPATAISADAVNKRIPLRIPRDSAFAELLVTAREQKKQDERIKVSDDLAQIPVTKLPGWKHQLQAFHFAQNKPGAMLAMDMGTGKSKVTIDLLQNNGAKRVLIICPKSVLAVWPKEFVKHCAVPYELLVPSKGTTAQRANEIQQAIDRHNLRKQSYMLVIAVNYDAVWRTSVASVIKAHGWNYIICDESHRIKAPNGVASKFIATLDSVSKQRLCLTGTPMPHSPMDAYAQYRFLDRSIYGSSYFTFKHTYGNWGGYGGHELLGYKNEDELNSRFYSVAYRVGKEVLDLPPVQHIQRTFELEPKARALYKELRDDFIAWVDSASEVTVANALTKLLRLQQLTGGYLPADSDDKGAPLREIHTQKRDLLKDVLEDINQREPVVIFARFKSDLDSIHKAAAELGRTSMELSGRKNQLAEWDNFIFEDGPILAVQIQAGGVGIDLTKARYCIYYSLGFSLGDYEQSLARTHRPGQTRETFYYHLVAANTVDEKVYETLSDRKAVVESILQEINGL